LKRVSQLETFGAGVKNLSFGILLEGDGMSNNVVNVFDLSLMASCYGKSVGEPGFDSRVDFNNDGTVNIFDLSLLASNYSKTGETP